MTISSVKKVSPAVWNIVFNRELKKNKLVKLNFRDLEIFFLKYPGKSTYLNLFEYDRLNLPFNEYTLVEGEIKNETNFNLFPILSGDKDFYEEKGDVVNFIGNNKPGFLFGISENKLVKKEFKNLNPFYDKTLEKHIKISDIEYYYKEIEKIFNLKMDYKNIYFLEYFHTTNMDSCIFYDSSDEVLTSAIQDKEIKLSKEKNLIHEMVHIFVNNKNVRSRFISEGLCEFIAIYLYDKKHGTDYLESIKPLSYKEFEKYYNGERIDFKDWDKNETNFYEMGTCFFKGWFQENPKS